MCSLEHFSSCNLAALKQAARGDDLKDIYSAESEENDAVSIRNILENGPKIYHLQLIFALCQIFLLFFRLIYECITG